MIEFVFPQSPGEWLAWLVAVSCIFVGLFLLVAPRVFMSFLGLGASTESGAGVSEFRSVLGGMLFGFGAACILFAQPLVYAALGLAFACVVVGRLISFVVDRATSATVLIATIVEGGGAFFPLAYAFGFIA